MASATKFTVGLIQMAMRAGREENLARAIDHIAAAAAQGAKVICLPELFATPYFCQVEDFLAFDLAEPIPGPTTEALSHAAAKFGAVIIAPIFERRAPGVYHNSAVVLDSAGRLIGHYRKMHIPDDPGFYEKYYFTPGDLGAVTVPTPFGRLGVLICWDQWFPEAARLAALAGADIIFYPTAIGWHPEDRDAVGDQQREAWIIAQRAHAIANGVFVAAVNRVGHERPSSGSGEGIVFWGSTFLAGPFGQILAQTPDNVETVLTAEIDLAQIEQTRRNWPFLRDRRIDAYAPLLERLHDTS
jgi:N-carbamoylputrescine amidase